MGWIQIGNVSVEHLNDQGQIKWMEQNADNHLMDFIEIMDGDTSRQYSVDINDVRTLPELMEAIEAGDVYRVGVSAEYTDAVIAFRALASEEHKGYWSGEIDFSFEAR